ncbi:MAG TPA: sulfatase-like hydrolase/transferase [Thermoanaerobaculia bacterium]|jgi:arylsulfatase A-like enzyme/Tfp pilus assembly protein PilF|nr:sulfatase-like hydrolase/transferase [Thermoanaerobaculia bacterium]
MTRNMRYLVGAFAIAATASLSFSCRRAARPNVLVITIDTLRVDHLGCYGYPFARTPAIDKLASESVRFTNAISAAPITMPAHSSIFTGLFPVAHGVRDNGAYALGENAVTLAERLRDAGYTTHAFVSALVLNRRYNLNQGFETYDDDLWAEDDPKLFMIRERQAPKTADRFLQWFGDWDKTRTKPFFTWIHFFDPHQPYRPSAIDAALSVSPYDAEIAGVDRQIGRIVETLRARGVLDNTLLILTADHGESLGEHGEQTHAIFVYDATVHVPLLIRYKPSLAPRVYEGSTRSVDIVPTILGILGLSGGESTDGHDLGAAIRGKEAAPVLPQYSESLLSEVGFGMAPLFAIRGDGYKYIRAPRPELYDLRNDPHELHDLHASLPRVAANLDAQLTQLMKDSSSHSVKAAASPMTRETEESLQALGYLASQGERSAMQGIDPKDGLPIHNKLEEARHFAQRREWAKSQALLLEVLAITPRNVSALNVLGLVAIKTGDADKAISYYQQSLAIDPQQFRVLGVLGGIALTRGELDHARDEFKAALAVNPHFAEGMANLGFIEALRGRDIAAAQWYAKGIAADPAFPRVYRRLGDLYYDRKDFAHAFVNYLKVIQLTPSDVRAIIQAGNCARRLGRNSEADTIFHRAELLRPQGWIPTYNRACLMAIAGKPEEALTTLIALTARHPVPLALVERDQDLAAVRLLPRFAELKRRLTDTEDDEIADE